VNKRSNDPWTQCTYWMQKKLQNPFAYDADQCFDTKVKYLTGRVSFWVKFPTVWSKTQDKYLGYAWGGRGGGEGLECVSSFGIDWYITTLQISIKTNLHIFKFWSCVVQKSPNIRCFFFFERIAWCSLFRVCCMRQLNLALNQKCGTHIEKVPFTINNAFYTCILKGTQNYCHMFAHVCRLKWSFKKLHFNAKNHGSTS